MKYSFIIPVYNRPDEIKELLESIVQQTYSADFEVVIIEDGSTISSEEIVNSFKDKINISYFYKQNSGPGASRNYGMTHAQGDYFIILDSDCILPAHYLEAVDDFLQKNFVHCFGGPDAASEQFSDIQKAINYAMTSFFTTGGIRGSQKSIAKFEPRSFNMGLSREAFEVTNGFGKIHPGEDPDLTIRLWKKGYQTAFIEDAFVYHKRRISWRKFYIQVNKFGLTRPILNYWHPEYKKVVYWLPSVFIIGGLIALLAFLFYKIWIGLFVYLSYFIVIFLDSKRQNKSTKIGFLSVWAVFLQFFGYGNGFMKATFWLFFSKKQPEILFSNLFFK